MEITKDDYKRIIIRKPTDNEQRAALIKTSDYAISCVTIHSSILNTLGLIDKVYRSKQTIIEYSNKKEINSVKKDINIFCRYFPKNYTTKKAWKFNDECIKHANFIDNLKKSSIKSWKGLIIPSFVSDFRTPSAFMKAEQYARHWKSTCSKEVMDGLSDYFCDEITFIELKEIAFPYFEKITTNSKRGHTQTVIWETAYKNQLKIEKELGENFTPKMYSFLLSPSNLELIQEKWGINLSNFQGSWAELCDYLYSPTVIKKIRDDLGVDVRSRSKCTVRKGTDFNDLKKYEKSIIKYQQRLGCSLEQFNQSIEKQKIENLKDELVKLQVQYNEGLFAIKHSVKHGRKGYSNLEKANKKIKSRINYLNRTIPKLQAELDKKNEAYEIIKDYTKRNKELKEFIQNTRSWEEVCELEKDSFINSIRKQKSEKEIPYYTWRFVCDKIDQKTATMIEEALEENLNKGSSINGEDGYINVTAFPMTKSYEFFVDYPKNSNLFRAFKNKGIELSKILVDGVARHLGKTFVNCQGETYFNNPMGKTLNGDMLEWIGV